MNNSTTDKENDFPARDDSYKSGVGAINEVGIGGTTTASETLDRVGTAAAEFNDSAINPLDRRINNTPGESGDDIANDDSPMKWIVPLIIFFILIVLGYSFCSKSPDLTKAARNAVPIATMNVV